MTAFLTTENSGSIETIPEISRDEEKRTVLSGFS